MTQTTELLLVPHTHWDREWYLTFQQFRMKLLRTVDAMLALLEREANYPSFLLDGQTVVLEDYLEVRPEQAGRLRALAREGRLFVGPWYVQPDEFLVGGESLIRNLQTGRWMGADYGGVMPVGYVPDTFGHIGQLPQVLRGFSLDNAVLWRGVGPDVHVPGFVWSSPDGSEVLVNFLNDETGYSNAARLPDEPESLAARLKMIGERMRPNALEGTCLLMNGTDHEMPQPGLAALLTEANERLAVDGFHARFGTLAEYAGILRQSEAGLPYVAGELRSSFGSHLLPGVLSTRTWLKQRNAACEALLTRWAEPAAAWAAVLGAEHPDGLLRLAWRFLLHNHAHDSICGCGIDQVHAEMLPRFDQSEQIGEGVAADALSYIAARVDTRGGDSALPVVVFNPTGAPRTDVAEFEVALPSHDVVITDANGHAVPHRLLETRETEIFTYDAEPALVAGMIPIVSEGRAMGYTISGVRLAPGTTDGVVNLDVTVLERGEPDIGYVDRAKEQILATAARGDVTSFHVTGRVAPTSRVAVLARDVPAYGGQVLHVRPAEVATLASVASNGHLPHAEYETDIRASETAIENQYLRVTVDARDGTFSLTDKLHGVEYSGLNRIEDGGDVGDLYNYCPPANDWVLSEPCRQPVVELAECGPLGATLRVTRVFLLSRSCTPDRQARSAEAAACTIVSEIRLAPENRRVEVRTTVENTVRDHRLRVAFPVPFVASESYAEGAFEVCQRPARQPVPADGEAEWQTWAELPVNTQPQRRFVDVSQGEYGLAVLNRGLPEYEVVPDEEESRILVTLLRATGWLSRDDLSTRKGHAGPAGIATPGAQGVGTHVFEYALVPHSGRWHDDGSIVWREAEAFEAPLRTAIAEPHAGALPAAWSFVRVEPAQLVLSTCKRWEHGDGVVMRLYNPTETDVAGNLLVALPFSSVTEVNLAEERIDERKACEHEQLPSGQTRVPFVVAAGQIRTLLFRNAPETAAF